MNRQEFFALDSGDMLKKASAQSRRAAEGMREATPRYPTRSRRRETAMQRVVKSFLGRSDLVLGDEEHDRRALENDWEVSGKDFEQGGDNG